MADLYTSLTRLKMAMNDGRLPPMTPVPVTAQDVIDPEYTIGYGALFEDAERGLRCPVRDCGRYFHNLTRHLNASHEGLSAAAVRQKLSIPSTARLVSQKLHEHLSFYAKVNLVAGRLGVERAAHARRCRMRHGDSIRAKKRNALTVGFKNLHDNCPTQLSHKIIDLHNRLGRTPTGRESNAVYGAYFTTAVIAVYGTWNNAIAQCGLESRRKASRYTVPDVLDGLQAYYDLHGCLPFVSTVKYGQQVPLLPCATSILRAFGVSSWPECMRRAASLLGIHGGRYGLPIQSAAQAVA